MKPSLGHIFLLSSFYAMILFGIVRLINDTLMKAFYWRPDNMEFAYVDMTTLLVISFIFFIFMFRLLNYFQGKKVSIIKEYGILSITAVIAVLLDMQISRWVFNLPIEIEDIPIALIPSILLSSLFYSYFRSQLIKKKIEEQSVQLQHIKNDQLQTELKLLKAQYNPHFLFNILNTVYFQIDEDNDTPRHTIELLSDLLRYQLYNDGEKVAVNKEIEYLDRYINLCRMRSKECLKLKIDFDEKLNDKKIYPLMFTPLVENAFKYVGGHYKIDITIKLLSDNDLLFEITNSIPDKEMPKKKGTSGIGIENLKRRLALLYPGSHTFETKKNNEFFVARLTLKL